MATAARSLSSEKSGGPAERNQFLFPRGLDLRGHRRNLRGDFQRNGLDAVHVAVQQVAGLDLQPADLHRSRRFQ